MAEELVLTFDFETPPPAADLGEVLAALARDYREMTRGRVLVVTRVESGSIWVTLTDAALAATPYVVHGMAAVTAINALAKFAENLQKWFGHAKSNEGKKRLYRKGKKASGQRSVEAIIKAAASTRSRVRVKHTTANGETLEAELTPSEATEAAAEEGQAKEEAISLQHDGATRLQISAPEVRGAIERLQQASAQNLSPTQIQAVVDVVVAVLQGAGAGNLLPEIASELEMHGMYEFAQAVRQHIRPSGGTQLLTTT
jgi:hypothetical protein